MPRNKSTGFTLLGKKNGDYISGQSGTLFFNICTEVVARPADTLPYYVPGIRYANPEELLEQQNSTSARPGSIVHVCFIIRDANPEDLVRGTWTLTLSTHYPPEIETILSHVCFLPVRLRALRLA